MTDRTLAYLTNSYARAGDTFVRREIEELRRLGWTVHTFSNRRPDEGERVSEDIRREQARTDYLLERGALRLVAALLRSALRSPRRVLRALRQARALRPPGLRAWAWHGIYLLEAAYLSEQLLARGVVRLHDHGAMNSATVAMLASTLSGVPFSMTVHGPHDFFAAEEWALGAKVAEAAATVCISDFGKSQCMLVTPPRAWPKLHVVRCGLERALLDAPDEPVADVPTLLCIGRLSPEKGHLVLVQAAARLKEAGVDFRVELVGDGPSRLEIEGAARALGVADRVEVVGWRSSADVGRAIAASRAVVLPSFAEGIPVVLMEAMALRRPVIATYVGGIPELVQPGTSGWLVPAGSVEELAAAMREALAAPVARLRRMGEEGRRRVLERHDLSVEVGRLAALLDDTAAPGEAVPRSPAAAGGRGA